MVANLIETFCGGSKKSLVMTLLEHEDLTREQLLELSRIAAQNAKAEGRKSKLDKKSGAHDE